MIRFASQRKSASVPIAVLVANVAFAAVLIGVPLYLGTVWYRASVWNPRDANMDKELSRFAVSLACLNLFDGFVAFLFFVVAGLALLYRMVWPLFGRLLAVFEAEHIVMHRVLLIALGTTFVGFGLPRLSVFLRGVIPH